MEHQPLNSMPVISTVRFFRTIMKNLQSQQANNLSLWMDRLNRPVKIESQQGNFNIAQVCFP